MRGHATLSIHFLFKYQITSQSDLHDYFSGSSVEPEKKNTCRNIVLRFFTSEFITLTIVCFYFKFHL